MAKRRSSFGVGSGSGRMMGAGSAMMGGLGMGAGAGGAVGVGSGLASGVGVVSGGAGTGTRFDSPGAASPYGPSTSLELAWCVAKAHHAIGGLLITSASVASG